MILNRKAIKQLLAILSLPERHASSNAAVLCNKYSLEDCELYIDNQMSEEGTELFETHCKNCLSCLSRLYQSDVELSPQKESKENAQLLLKTEDLLNKIDQNQNRTSLEIVIRIADKAIELLSTTGVLLQNLQTMPVRNTSEEKQREEVPLRVLQDCANLPYSMQASLLSSKDRIITLTVSIYNRETDQFVQDVNARIKTPSTENILPSDINGAISFKTTEIGIHELTLTSGEETIGRMQLTMK